MRVTPDWRGGSAVTVVPGEHRPSFAKHGGENFYHLIAVDPLHL